MQDMEQQHHRALDDISLPSHHTHSDDIQNIIHRIKSSEFSHLLHNKYSERESPPVETQDRLFPHRLQQQASIKQQLVNVLQDLELHKCVWEEEGKKVEEQCRDWEKEQKQSQTQIQEAKKVAVVNWWKTLGVERANTRTKQSQRVQELCEAQAKLQQTEQTITDMREQVVHLTASLKSAQERIAEQKNSSRVLHIDKGINTEREEEDRAVRNVVKDQRDAAVVTEISGGAASEQEQTHRQVTADRLLETLRRMEAMVNSALEAAEVVRESEQRVSQVRVRMESITQRVEEALGRTTHTDEQLNVLEARITGKGPAQSPDPSLPADPEPDAAGFTAETREEPEDRDQTESSPSSPAISEVSETTQLPINGMLAAWHKTRQLQQGAVEVHFFD
ncbi:golgin subfamily A member 6-like protein 1 [Anabas testudineus]|uniref:golgin subfamily A member 6-like protein 1 n=1 Tax=Anabas testudineus TaxID=64144 RepID=UPI000E45F6AC|nr:golgin subfamily A member 6-like protein 1 [Anabas testudineus]